MFNILALLTLCVFSFQSFAYNQGIADIQRSLMDRGFDSGPVDGEWGKKTQRAIQLFQEENGHFVTGTVNSVTARALGMRQSPDKVTNGPSKEQTINFIKSMMGSMGECNRSITEKHTNGVMVIGSSSIGTAFNISNGYILTNLRHTEFAKYYPSEMKVYFKESVFIKAKISQLSPRVVNDGLNVRIQCGSTPNCINYYEERICTASEDNEMSACDKKSFPDSLKPKHMYNEKKDSFVYTICDDAFALKFKKAMSHLIKLYGGKDMIF